MKSAGALMLLLSLAVMGLAFTHPFGNPRVEPARGFDTLLQGADISSDAKKVLIRKCADCHSNETRWPVYARLAPGSWLIERDIIEARKKMNLSNWERMNSDAQDVLIAKMIAETKSGHMPPLQYRALHRDAKLTATDIATLSTMRNAGKLGAGSIAAADAARGKIVFGKRCTGCHAMEGDREGPRLAGVYGRRAGSVPSFEYSAELKNSGIIWSDSTLEKWLSDPDMVVPGTKMDFLVPKAQERSDLIAYLKQ